MNEPRDAEMTFLPNKRPDKVFVSGRIETRQREGRSPYPPQQLARARQTTSPKDWGCIVEQLGLVLFVVAVRPPPVVVFAKTHDE